MSDEIYAFPAANAHAVLQEGMTLRDWFAGQAMSGWLASFSPEGGISTEGVASFAYRMADDMLRAREAK